MPKVSVIVPVYKKEKYLHRCVDSILSQTFPDFELILVDDGSPDNCGAICDEYAAKDSRIKVIHKKNGGVSSARNAGLNIACGEYVMFCDSDDQITEYALMRMFEAFCENDVQMIVGGFEYTNFSKSEHYIQIRKEYLRCNQQIDLDGSSAMYSFWVCNNMLSSCGKLYKRNLITENSIKFRENQIVLEDYGFVIDYLSHCKKISMIEDIVYQCFYDVDVPLQKRRSRIDFFDDVIYVSNKLADYLSRIGCTHIDDFLNHTVYPTLHLSYTFLWNRPFASITERLHKYQRIKQAISEPHFQKMIIHRQNNYSKFELFCYTHNSIFGLLFLRMLRNYF